jgi:hypothetical protein
MSYALGWHLRLRLQEDRVLAPSLREKRILARTILERGAQARLLAFAAVDTHIHLALLCPEGEAVELQRRVQIALRSHLSLGEIPWNTWRKPIADLHHLASLFAYILKQVGHHGIQDAGHVECSNLLDLLGLRTTGLYTAPLVRTHLPRIRRENLLEWLGVTELPTGVASLDPLMESVLSATALPALEGRSREVIQARCAAVEAGLCHEGPSSLAERLGCDRSTVHRLSSRAAPPALVRAIEQQLALRQSPHNPFRGTDLVHDPGASVEGQD